MKRDGTSNADFYWQNGYAAFSVSASQEQQVKRYIENQEEHHRKMTFQDELRALFMRHQVEFIDELFAPPITQGGAARLAPLRSALG